MLVLFAVPYRASLAPESTKLFFRLLWDVRNLTTKVPYCIDEEFTLVEQLDSSIEAVLLLLSVINELNTDKLSIEGIMEDAVAHLQNKPPASIQTPAADLIPALRSAVRTLWTRHASIEDPRSRLLAIKREVGIWQSAQRICCHRVHLNVVRI